MTDCCYIASLAHGEQEKGADPRSPQRNGSAPQPQALTGPLLRHRMAQKSGNRKGQPRASP
jgi:hypothetical protein